MRPSRSPSLVRQRSNFREDSHEGEHKLAMEGFFFGEDVLSLTNFPPARLGV